MKKWPDRTGVDVGDYNDEDGRKAAEIVRRLVPSAARRWVDFSKNDREQLKGMLLYGRQIARAYRRLEFGKAILSADQVDEMVQDALIFYSDLWEQTSTWNLSRDLWSCLEHSAPQPPRSPRARNPLKSVSLEMAHIERAREAALIEGVLRLEESIAASLALLFHARTNAARARKKRLVLWPKLRLM